MSTRCENNFAACQQIRNNANELTGRPLGPQPAPQLNAEPKGAELGGAKARGAATYNTMWTPRCGNQKLASNSVELIN